ncbi:universal stress protein [Noviherbaspirillum sp.]|uniref:universal stress protein n=1 Tax=Noviherbaspirillum sp. TaxID=1926288 RepID=UPI002B48608E|nr:universal stress protein [Noviherbaspirillum sp.]HJV81190.1 universal stress protein [Noviherbaspirillum sp.]
MFKTILVPTDGSTLAEEAIHAAVEFAKESDGYVVGLSVAEPYPFSPLSESAMTEECVHYEDEMLARARQNVQKVADAAKAMKVPCETVVEQSFSPYEMIIDTARNMSCDVIFMASHGRKGLSELLLGSETQKVLAHSTIPVLVIRQNM